MRGIKPDTEPLHPLLFARDRIDPRDGDVPFVNRVCGAVSVRGNYHFVRFQRRGAADTITASRRPKKAWSQSPICRATAGDEGPPIGVVSADAWAGAAPAIAAWMLR